MALRCHAIASVAHGGQIMCDSTTLEGIRSHLTELHKGCTTVTPHLSELAG